MARSHKKEKIVDSDSEEEIIEKPKKSKDKKKRKADSDNEDEHKEVKQHTSDDESERKAAKKAKKAAKKAKKEKDFETVPVEEESNNPYDELVTLQKETQQNDDDEFDLGLLKKKSSKSAPSTTTSEDTNTHTSAPSDQITRIFLGNLPFKITDEMLHETFGPCGPIAGIHWVTDKATGKFYGSAFIDYENASSASAALSLNGTELLGRPVKVGMATGQNKAGANRYNNKQKQGGHLALAPISEKPEGTTTVFLGNLSFNIDEDAIREKFSHCGDIKEVRWVEKDGEFKGCGFIEFHSTEATDEAIKLNGADCMGRPMRVDYSGSK